MGDIFTGATIYAEECLTLVFATERLLLPTIAVPLIAVMGAQYVIAHLRC